VDFEWDDDKNEENIRNHGIDLSDACEAFSGPLLYEADTRENYGEERWIGIGQIKGRVIVLAFVERASERIRLFSARKATRNEKNRFEEAIKNELGQN
jgi:uncharacterized DUF497 family protein